MAVFEEYFPSEKEVIQKYAERQKKLEELSAILRKSENSSSIRPTSLIPRLVPTKPSLNEILSEIHRDTENNLKQSIDVDKKIEKIHKMIENVDNINFMLTSEKEIVPFDGSGDDNEVAGPGIDSIKPEHFELPLVSSSMSKKLEKLDEKTLDTSDSIPKRVIRLVQNDSALEISDYKPPQIKPTKASILKSKFNTEKSQKNSPLQSKSFRSKSTIELLPRTSKTVSFAKFEQPKKAVSKNLSPSVRKILDDAKEKHKAKSLVKSNVQVNIVDLFMI